MSDKTNEKEGADPGADIRKQSPGETTTDDLAGESGRTTTKVQDLSKAGLNGADPNEESPA